MAAERQNGPPRDAVNLGLNISQLFPSGDDQLQFQSNDIFDNLERWISIEVSEGTPVYDNLSVYMVRAFTTLLDSFMRQNRITEHDKLTIVAHLNHTMNHSLHLLDAEDQGRAGKYTDFCRVFFRAEDGTEARNILEALSADSQCNAVIGKYEIGRTRCWICNLKLSGETKPQCEHILPIIDALFYLNLYQYSNSFRDLGGLQQAILVLEYLWSEKCCNETKNNDQWLAFDGDGICYINRSAIEASMTRIAVAANNPDGGRACWEHLREYTDSDIKATVNGKPNIDRIERELKPIVDTINSIVGYIDRRIQSRGNLAKKQAIRAITVFKYLTLIRFLSNISGSKMVDAFMNNVVNTNAASKHARKQQMNAIREAEKAEEIAEKEAIRAQREASRAARQAEKESEKNRRMMMQLEQRIGQFKVDLEKYIRLLKAANSERGRAVQTRQIERAESSIHSLQEEMDALRALSGGQRGGTYTYKTHVLHDFQKEMHYIMLLSFYPIYINRTNKGNPLSEEEYMSTPGILEMAMRYFIPKEATLIDLSSNNVAKHSMTGPSMTLYNMVGPVSPVVSASTIQRLNFTPNTKKRPNSNANSGTSNATSGNKRIRLMSTAKAVSPVIALSPVMAASPLYGGQTRKRRQKRITRKKSNH